MAHYKSQSGSGGHNLKAFDIAKKTSQLDVNYKVDYAYLVE
jgi:hypothetical protein